MTDDDHRLADAEPASQPDDAGEIAPTHPGPDHRLQEAAKQLRLFRQHAKVEPIAEEPQMIALARAEFLIRGVADARGDRDA